MLEVVPQANILEDLDIQILDVKRMGSRKRSTRVVNIYNGKRSDLTESVNILTAMNFDSQIPTIITGDWNTHHPCFAQMKHGQSPTHRAEQTAEWTVRQGLELLNNWNQVTWSELRDGILLESSLDLTFQNAAAAESNILKDWRIDDQLNADSDHFATTFTISSEPETPIKNTTQTKFNWKQWT
jgi:hypothetical protein